MTDNTRKMTKEKTTTNTKHSTKLKIE